MAEDIDELERLYDELNDYLACHVNYPGWQKGIYPERSTNKDAVRSEFYTFAVHPDYHGRRLGRRLMEAVLDYAGKAQMKAVRLDVYEKNLPAIKLYESCCFQYIDKVDLGYGEYGLNWFSLYQLEL